MKKYYLHNGNSQEGPFDIAELRNKNTSGSTAVWHEGLTTWTPAQNLVELQPLFNTATPPSFHSTTPAHPIANTNYERPQTSKKKNPTELIIALVAFVLVALTAIVLLNNPDAIPGVKLEINTPKSTVVTSRVDGQKSGLLNARTTVYATIMNQGGDGNVLVTFYVYQGNKSYDRTESIYMYAGTAENLEVTFEEVDYVSGDVTYNMTASSRNENLVA